MQVSIVKKLQAKLLVSIASNALAAKGTCNFSAQKIMDSLECVEIELHSICAIATSISKNGVTCEYDQEKKIVKIYKDNSMFDSQVWNIINLFNKKFATQAQLSEARKKLIISYIQKYDYITVLTAIEGAKYDNWFVANGMTIDYIFKSQQIFENYFQKALKEVSKIIGAKAIKGQTHV